MSPQRWEIPDTSGMGAAEAVALNLARCPWAAGQSHASLLTHLIEEAHELSDALDAYAAEPGEETRGEVEAELGDVLYQVLFHAALLDRAAAGRHRVPIDEPLPGTPLDPAAIERIDARLTAKIIRRHPHVFASHTQVPLAEVERRYEQIKAAERGSSTDPLRASFASLPAGMPALARAQAVLGRIERLERPVPELPETSGAGNEEAATTSGAGSEEAATTSGAGSEEAATTSGAETERTLGAALFALARQAQAAGLDAEAALRRVVSEVEERALAEQTEVTDAHGAHTAAAGHADPAGGADGQ